MSLEDLTKLDCLIDEEQWSDKNHRSNVRVGIVLPAIVVGLAGCWAIGVGDGGWLTWIGLVAFACGLFTFIVANVRSIGERE